MGTDDRNEDDLIESSETAIDNEPTETRKFLLTEETFENFKKVQHEILDKTEISPSIRKMVNMIITKEEIDKVKEELILKYQE
jgi:hypothetical protein